MLFDICRDGPGVGALRGLQRETGFHELPVSAVHAAAVSVDDHFQPVLGPSLPFGAIGTWTQRLAARMSSVYAGRTTSLRPSMTATTAR